MVDVLMPSRPNLLRALNNDTRLVMAFEGLFEQVISQANTAVGGGGEGSFEAFESQDAELSFPAMPQDASDDVDYIEFSTPQAAIANRRIQSADEGLEFGANGVGLTLGRDRLVFATNNSGSNISKGAGVMRTGGDISVAKAVSNGTVDAADMLGIALQDIDDAESGFVMQQGQMSGLDTSGYAVGDYLYFDASMPGDLTNTRPAPSNLRSPIATVLTSDASDGAILVHMRAERKFSDLQDVDVTGLADGDFMQWDATNTKWVQITGATGTFTALDGEVVTVTNGLITAIA